MFRFTASKQISGGTLLYVPYDFSLTTMNRQGFGVASVLVNDIQIEISDDGLAIAVWGMCPHTMWREGRILAPVSVRGKLWFDGELTPGISIRVTQPGKYWPVTFDASSGWLHIGERICTVGHSIEFMEGCLALLREGQIVGLYLHPYHQALNPPQNEC